MLDLCFCASQSRTEIWEQDVSVFRCRRCSNQNFIWYFAKLLVSTGGCRATPWLTKIFHKAEAILPLVLFSGKLCQQTHITEELWMVLQNCTHRNVTGSDTRGTRARGGNRSAPHRTPRMCPCRCGGGGTTHDTNWGTKPWCSASQCGFFCAVRTGTELALAIYNFINILYQELTVKRLLFI